MHGHITRLISSCPRTKVALFSEDSGHACRLRRLRQASTEPSITECLRIKNTRYNKTQKTPLGAVKCSHCHSPAARLGAPCDVFPHIAAVNTALVRNLVVHDADANEFFSFSDLMSFCATLSQTHRQSVRMLEFALFCILPYYFVEKNDIKNMNILEISYL